MLTKGKTREALERFKGVVINQSRAMLTKKNKNTSKKLFNSIKGDVKAYEKSFVLEFYMEEYGIYQDKGVSGTKVKYNTPYSYTDKMPPRKKIEDWVSSRRFQFRDAKGRFMSYKSMSFLIARSIFRKGIKPSLFFTQPFENAFKTLPKELTKAYQLDIEDLLAFTLKNERLK